MKITKLLATLAFSLLVSCSGNRKGIEVPEAINDPTTPAGPTLPADPFNRLGETSEIILKGMLEFPEQTNVSDIRLAAIECSETVITPVTADFLPSGEFTIVANTLIDDSAFQCTGTLTVSNENDVYFSSQLSILELLSNGTAVENIQLIMKITDKSTLIINGTIAECENNTRFNPETGACE